MLIVASFLILVDLIGTEAEELLFSGFHVFLKHLCMNFRRKYAVFVDCFHGLFKRFTLERWSTLTTMGPGTSIFMKSVNWDGWQYYFCLEHSVPNENNFFERFVWWFPFPGMSWISWKNDPGFLKEGKKRSFKAFSVVYKGLRHFVLIR